MTRDIRTALETKTVAELVKLSNNLPRNARVSKRQIVQWKESKTKLIDRLMNAPSFDELVKAVQRTDSDVLQEIADEPAAFHGSGFYQLPDTSELEANAHAEVEAVKALTDDERAAADASLAESDVPRLSRLMPLDAVAAARAKELAIEEDRAAFRETLENFAAAGMIPGPDAETILEGVDPEKIAAADAKLEPKAPLRNALEPEDLARERGIKTPGRRRLEKHADADKLAAAATAEQDAALERAAKERAKEVRQFDKRLKEKSAKRAAKSVIVTADLSMLADGKPSTPGSKAPRPGSDAEVILRQLRSATGLTRASIEAELESLRGKHVKISPKSTCERFQVQYGGKLVVDGDVFKLV